MAGQNQDRRQDKDACKRRMLPFLVIPIIFLIAGIAILPYSPKFGLIWIVFCVYFTVVILKNAAGKQAQRKKPERQAPARPDRPAPSAPRPSRPASSAAPRPTGYERVDRRVYSAGQEHDHIRSIALSPQRKLEQLETLKGAGLLTDEEYRDKKREIMQKI